MKRTIIPLTVVLLASMAACKKDQSASSSVTEIQQAATALQAVAIGVSARTAGDSVYAINTCKSSERLSAIDFAALPETSIDYLLDNYEDYTEVKAFSIKDTTGTVTGYVAIIKVDDSPVAVKFDSSGSFVNVLEQRDGKELLGKVSYHGGKGKGNAGKDTVALSALPVAITSYMTNNYPSDTLLYAFLKRNGDYVIVSKNQGVFTTTFSADGSFISHNEIKSHKGRISEVAVSDLPAAIIAYLDTTYPGYAIEKSYSVSKDSAVAGYVLLIDANDTRYGVAFDKDGNFVGVKLIK